VGFSRSFAALLVALSLGACELAQAQVAVPPLSARVTDLTNTLTVQQVATLEQTLQAFEARKGSQIGVLIVPSTQPESIEQYSIRVVEQWRLGRKGVDDGALLIIAKNDHTLRIEVGYGLEGALNDAVCARIIREIITPRFRQGDFYGGITDGIARMIGVVDGEPLPPPAPALHSATGGGAQYIFVLLLVMVFGGLVCRIVGQLPGALITGGAAGFLIWLFAGALAIAIPVAVFAFLFTMANGSSMGRVIGATAWGGGFGGGFGGGSGGGFGGGSGGGFGGGGGGFGGGGASGGW
jgi:uncharacterized protein